MAGNKPDISKTELPLGSGPEIADMVQQFLAGTLPYRHWTHRAHLALGIYHVRNYPLDVALDRVRHGIVAYNQCCGDPVGYNETITCVFMRKLATEQLSVNSEADIALELGRLQGLCSVEWLYHYYSKSLIWSDAAKAVWLEPDINPLDF